MYNWFYIHFLFCIFICNTAGGHTARTPFDHAVMPDDLQRGQENALHVKQKAHFLYVFAVQAGFFGNFQFIPTVDLCPAGKPRTDVVGAVFVALSNQVVLIPQRGAGTNDGHISCKENTKYLWQLVK